LEPLLAAELRAILCIDGRSAGNTETQSSQAMTTSVRAVASTDANKGDAAAKGRQGAVGVGSDGSGGGVNLVAGGVEFEAGSAQDLMRAGLWLGTASHLMVRLHQEPFKCRALNELEKKANKLVEWRRWLVPGQKIVVEVSARKSKLIHTGAIAERVQSAIDKALVVLPSKQADTSDKKNKKNGGSTTGLYYGKKALAEMEEMKSSSSSSATARVLVRLSAGVLVLAAACDAAAAVSVVVGLYLQGCLFCP
jgi:hypothetical protein